MARIGAEELEQLKRETDLVALVRASGVELSGSGDNLRGLCPFHEESEASFSVSAQKQLWNCLGSCQEGGDVIKFVMLHKRVNFRHAVELLKHGVAAANGGGTVPVLPCPVDISANDTVLMDQVVRFYEERLKQGPEAQRYLLGRGIKNPEVITRCRLGYADRMLGLRLPHSDRKDGHALRARLEALGIFRPSGHEHLAGSLVVPILDGKGVVQGLYGRKIGARLRTGTPLHLYLPGPHKGVFNEAGLHGQGTVVLCEALLDALSFMECGMVNVTSSYGVGGFTDDILAAIKAAGIQRVVIAYDADEAGNQAAERLAPRLYDAGMLPLRVVFPPGKDANECLQEGMDLRALADRAVEIDVGAHRAAPAPPRTAEPARHATATPVAAMLAAQSKVNGATHLAAEEKAPAPPPQPLPALASGVRVEEVDDDLFFTTGNRQYRVRGLKQNQTTAAMKLAVKAERLDLPERVHVDGLDFISKKQRATLCKDISVELGVDEDIITRDVARIYNELDIRLTALVKARLSPQKAAPVILTDDEKLAALEFLRDPRILERITDDARACGIVGESANMLVGYLCAISRFLPKPLGVAIQSSSSAGKTSLMDAVLAFVPSEHKKKFSAMTSQSLFYMTGDELKHKVLAVVEEQGAERVSYALKLLLSEGRLSNVSTIKNPQTGNLEAKENLVEGPTAVFYTTTSPEPDDELTNRVILLTVNESREQTRRIHQLQWERRTLQGMVASEKREALLKLHQDAQRMLRPLAVVNEARERRSCPDNRIWMRRDNEKYLCLVDSLAFLRQYQKEVRVLHRCGKQVEYVVVDDVDRELAEALASVVLEPSLDELLPQDRKLLDALRDLVGRVCADQGLDPDQVRFTRRQARQFIGWTEKQVRVHMDRLVEHEYVAVHRGRHGQGFVYELTYDAEPVGGTGMSTNFVHSESHFVPPSSRGVQAASADGNGEKPTSSTDPENTYRAPDLENASQMKTDSP